MFTTGNSQHYWSHQPNTWLRSYTYEREAKRNGVTCHLETVTVHCYNDNTFNELIHGWNALGNISREGLTWHYRVSPYVHKA
jgi:hypothetical protein